MKKSVLCLLTILVLFLSLCLGTGCGSNEKVIKVCASELPHADILENAVADILKEKGYTLKVYVLDWTIQNDSVATKDYDANYFQHIPYLETYAGTVSLFASCKVHYEPLGIYQGKSSGALVDGKTFAICNDESNAIRALELLKAKGVIDNLPVDGEGKLTISGTTWTADNGVEVTLIAEELLVAALHILNRADRYTCLTNVTYYTWVVSVVTTVCSQVECNRKTLLTSCEVTTVESVRLLCCRETCVLTDSPRTHYIHSRVRTTQERCNTCCVVQVLHTLQICRSIVILYGYLLGSQPRLLSLSVASCCAACIFQFCKFCSHSFSSFD